MRELFYFIRSLIVFVTSPLLMLWYSRYWFKSLNKHQLKENLKNPKLVGFTDKMFYKPGEMLKFFVSSEVKKRSSIRVCKLEIGQKETLLTNIEFDVFNQQSNIDSAKEGCNWKCNHELSLTGYKQGYYKIYLDDSFIITFIIGVDKPKASICVVAPVSTWVAYNHYGGQSAYDNYLEDKTVYYLSSLRPNLALEYNQVENIHDMNIEANIFNWFNEYYDVTLIPDYELEKGNIESDIVILSYHCEYFSSKMYQGLKKIAKKASIINLGANQVYWKIKWNAEYTQMELRKDVSFFSSTLRIGGKWRHSFWPEERLLNASYTDAGIGTFAPYKVLLPQHWLFDGLDVSEDSLFGSSGLNSLGICGDETDKSTLISSINVETIARGVNCDIGGLYENYDSKASKWNSKGGGDLCFRLTNDNKGILNTGSVQSGSGLGTDEVFTKIIQNFILKFTH